MEANRRGIDKLGIGMTTDGMTIDEENGKTSMLHKNMWKLIEGPPIFIISAHFQ